MIERLQENQKNCTKVNCSDIKLGIRYSAPVFFEDGLNMFLAEGKTVKQYHIDALKRWAIPFLLTYGRAIRDDDISFNKNFIEEMEEIEELEELEEIV